MQLNGLTAQALSLSLIFTVYLLALTQFKNLVLLCHSFNSLTMKNVRYVHQKMNFVENASNLPGSFVEVRHVKRCPVVFGLEFLFHF